MSTATVQVREVAVVRGGDKGDDCHIAIVPQSTAAYQAIWEQLTPEALQAALPGAISGAIDRYQLPNIEGIVLVMHGAFDGGPARGWQLDRRMPLAVHIGEMLIRLGDTHQEDDHR
jgi:hypothetical protein